MRPRAAGRSEKIAISLPASFLRRIEELRRQTGETRSAMVRRLIEERLRQQERGARVREYEDGYRKQPETAGEIAAAEAAASALLAEEPWE
jgi:metal-responsive CopG/Arc/MetJ family transcriptional regulator